MSDRISLNFVVAQRNSARKSHPIVTLMNMYTDFSALFRRLYGKVSN